MPPKLAELIASKVEDQDVFSATLLLDNLKQTWPWMKRSNDCEVNIVTFLKLSQINLVHKDIIQVLMSFRRCN